MSVKDERNLYGLLTLNAMFDLVRLKYWSDPIMLMYWLASSKGMTSTLFRSLPVTIRVSQYFLSNSPYLSRNYVTYFLWFR